MAQFNDKVDPKHFLKMPDEYRDLLVRLLTIQADCEIGGPHIYVDHWTLRAPSVDDQWRVARIASITRSSDSFGPHASPPASQAPNPTTEIDIASD